MSVHNPMRSVGSIEYLWRLKNGTVDQPTYYRLEAISIIGEPPTCCRITVVAIISVLTALVNMLARVCVW